MLELNDIISELRVECKPIIENETSREILSFLEVEKTFKQIKNEFNIPLDTLQESLTTFESLRLVDFYEGQYWITGFAENILTDEFIPESKLQVLDLIPVARKNRFLFEAVQKAFRGDPQKIHDLKHADYRSKWYHAVSKGFHNPGQYRDVLVTLFRFLCSRIIRDNRFDYIICSIVPAKNCIGIYPVAFLISKELNTPMYTKWEGGERYFGSELLRRGLKAIILHDTITTGTTLVEFYDELQKTTGKIEAIINGLDRRKVGAEQLSERELSVLNIFSIKDLRNYYYYTLPRQELNQDLRSMWNNFISETGGKNSPKVFFSHVNEDKERIMNIYTEFEKNGIDAWVDKEKLEGGDFFEEEIDVTLETTDFAAIFFSKNSVNKKSFMQTEIHKIIKVYQRQPHGTNFIIPIRLDKCDIPRIKLDANHYMHHIQYVDVFDDKTETIQRLMDVIWKKWRKRQQ